MSSKAPLTAKLRDELTAQRDEARAEVERLKTLAALHWSPVVLKADVPPPANGSPYGTLTKGWIAHQHDQYAGAAPDIWPACSSSGGHGLRSHEKTNSQSPIAVSSTKSHALQVLRCEKEAEFARRLRAIDAAIERELAREKAEGQALTEALS